MTQIPQTREAWLHFNPKEHPNFSSLPSSEQDRLVVRTDNIQSMVRNAVEFSLKEAKETMQDALNGEVA